MYLMGLEQEWIDKKERKEVLQVEVWRIVEVKWTRDHHVTNTLNRVALSSK